MVGYYVARLLLMPGIVLHELAHYYFCRLAGAVVHEVRYFSFGHPAGYVIHTAPRRLRAHFAIALGPLVVNSVVAVLLFVAALATAREMAPLDPIDWLPGLARLVPAAWLGTVVAIQALPSNGDAISLWQVARWHADNGNYLAWGALPVAQAIRLANWLRGIWIDWVYAGALFWVALQLSAR